MRTVENIYTSLRGVTVGIRKDGSVAVLFEDNSIEWFDSITFNSYYEVV